MLLPAPSLQQRRTNITTLPCLCKSASQSVTPSTPSRKSVLTQENKMACLESVDETIQFKHWFWDSRGLHYATPCMVEIKIEDSHITLTPSLPLSALSISFLNFKALLADDQLLILKIVLKNTWNHIYEIRAPDETQYYALKAILGEALLCVKDLDSSYEEEEKYLDTDIDTCYDNWAWYPSSKNHAPAIVDAMHIDPSRNLLFLTNSSKSAHFVINLDKDSTYKNNLLMAFKPNHKRCSIKLVVRIFTLGIPTLETHLLQSPSASRYILFKSTLVRHLNRIKWSHDKEEEEDGEEDEEEIPLGEPEDSNPQNKTASSTDDANAKEDVELVNNDELQLCDDDIIFPTFDVYRRIRQAGAKLFAPFHVLDMETLCLFAFAFSDTVGTTYHAIAYNFDSHTLCGYDSSVNPPSFVNYPCLAYMICLCKFISANENNEDESLPPPSSLLHHHKQKFANLRRELERLYILRRYGALKL